MRDILNKHPITTLRKELQSIKKKYTSDKKNLIIILQDLKAVNKLPKDKVIDLLIKHNYDITKLPPLKSKAPPKTQPKPKAAPKAAPKVETPKPEPAKPKRKYDINEKREIKVEEGRDEGGFHRHEMLILPDNPTIKEKQFYMSVNMLNGFEIRQTLREYGLDPNKYKTETDRRIKVLQLFMTAGYKPTPRRNKPYRKEINKQQIEPKAGGLPQNKQEPKIEVLPGLKMSYLNKTKTIIKSSTLL